MNQLPITPFGSLKTGEEYFRFGGYPVRLADVNGERYKQPDSGLIYFRLNCNGCDIDEQVLALNKYEHEVPVMEDI